MENQPDQYINMSFESSSKLIELFEENEIENAKTIETDQQHILEALNDTTYKFYTLTFSLKKEFDKDRRRLFYLHGYLGSLSNNCFVIKKLFNTGWHLQAQIVMRAQFEQLNVIIAVLSDDSFFERISTPNNGEELITPKQIHAERAIKKLLMERQDKSAWEGIKEVMEHLYDEFSKVAHGNLFHVSMGSMQEDDEDSEKLIPGIGGVSNPLGRTLRLTMEMNNYSQMLWMLINDKLSERNLTVKDETVHDYVKLNKPFLLGEDGKRIST